LLVACIRLPKTVIVIEKHVQLIIFVLGQSKHLYRVKHSVKTNVSVIFHISIHIKTNIVKKCFYWLITFTYTPVTETSMYNQFWRKQYIYKIKKLLVYKNKKLKSQILKILVSNKSVYQTTNLQINSYLLHSFSIIFKQILYFSITCADRYGACCVYQKLIDFDNTYFKSSRHKNVTTTKQIFLTTILMFKLL